MYGRDLLLIEVYLGCSGLAFEALCRLGLVGIYNKIELTPECRPEEYVIGGRDGVQVRLYLY